ncbi:MAG TPA: DRTGG domain-containing protein [Anaerolineae bacterium]|nr:DRTGG domain-containing protein [Anaerolineae bacterium]HQJ52225.1 DRTGG domain-containing protein [Anaerolineae bacterium]
MTLGEVARKLNLALATSTGSLDVEVTGGYASDLLSCVMAKARKGNVWVTLQSHLNIVAVAALLQLAGIIVTEGMTPDEATIQKANEEEIPLLTTAATTFTVVTRLGQLGIRGVDDTGESWDKMTGE